MGALERNPGGGDNWVEKAGGLPAYIEKIAKRLHETRGMDVSRSIATAVNMVKKWAAGGDNVNPDTRAKAAAALAEWDAKRAKARASASVDMAATADDVDLVLDLAYGDHKPPYDWKHGYKPISPQAMRIKAKKEKSPNGGKRRRVAGEGPAKGRTPAQAKAADDAQRGRGVPGADTGDAPKRKSIIGDQPSTPPTKRFESAADRAARDKAAADLARRGRERRGEEKPQGAPSTPSKTPTIAAVSSTDVRPSEGREAGGNPKGMSNAELLTAINRTGAVDRADATPEQKRRLAALINERHARAEDGRMPKLKGKTRTTAADGSELGAPARATPGQQDAERRESKKRTGSTPKRNVERANAGDLDVEVQAQLRRDGMVDADNNPTTKGKAAGLLPASVREQKLRDNAKPGDATPPPPRKSTLREDLGGDSSRLDPPKVRAAAAKRKAALEGKTTDQLKRAAGQHRAAGRTEQAAEVDAEIAKRRAAGQVPGNTPEYRAAQAALADNDRQRADLDKREAESKAAVARADKARAANNDAAELRAAADELRKHNRNLYADQLERRAQVLEGTRDVGQARAAGRSAGSSESGQTTSTPDNPAERLGKRSDADLERMATNLQRRAEGSGNQADARRRLAEVKAEQAKRRDPSRIIRGVEAGLEAEREGYTARDSDTARISPATAARMSDDQLEKTLDRLAEAGDFSSPAFKAVEAEQAKREDARNARRAEGNRPRR